MASLQAAFDKAAEVKNDSVDILVMPGDYFMSKPVLISKAHSRKKQNRILVKASGENFPTFYGGQLLPRFKAAQNGQWLAEIPEVAKYRWIFEQLYVNGKRAINAKAPNDGFFKPRYVKEIAVQVDSSWKNDYSVMKIGVPAEAVKWLKGLSKVELADIVVEFFHNWTVTKKRVISFDERDTTFLVTGLALKPWNKISAASKFRFTNLRFGIDAPGEWFLEYSGRLYYKPLPGEKLEDTKAVAPLTEKLLVLRGSGPGENAVSHIHFKGLKFKCTGFYLPEIGLEPSQATSSIEAAFQADFVDNITIQQCEFSNIATNAIWFRKSCSDSGVKDCYLSDLGGGGIKVGETSMAPKKEDNTHQITIDNNIIQSGGHIFAASPGIIVFHGFNNRITHNDISLLKYTGISVGWTWGYGKTSFTTDNLIANNNIRYLGWGELDDMGGIYTLGPSKGTIIKSNIIHDIVPARYGGWGIYADEGTDGVLIEDNLVYGCKNGGFHQNYGRNNVITNNIFALNGETQMQVSRTDVENSLVFKNNVVYADNDKFIKGNWNAVVKESANNVFFNAGKQQVASAAHQGAAREARSTRAELKSVSGDPKFKNPRKGDFEIGDPGLLKKAQFSPIDYSKIGVYGSSEWKAKASTDEGMKAKFDALIEKK